MREVYSPLPDLLQLLGVINGDMYTKMHPRLGQIDIQTSDLRIGDTQLHR